ncbi:PRC-barrel domain-containing protein [Hydrogenophaga sp. PAMC20947]|uniref:PRC-barrel domain-containing protein n=1 Tax=Hydrogenophaga sp. PAMC20947 TaxID=2565558 RepID=UPI00109DBDB8|nr:PRC-barrel domain-containing protein [Hydrogenophaga sp. PAMC20947]QCB45552.1 PRC-barrel domain containing protein [Hydrogenophaga sp. PAMC20947]
MLRTLEDLCKCTIGATDGPIGRVRDLYLDDEAWVVRYLVIDTDGWLTNKKVLISPISVGEPNWAEQELHVSISREQVRNSPDVDTEKPVTRQHELEYSSYYGYPIYWGSAGLWGYGLYPSLMQPAYERPESQQATPELAPNVQTPPDESPVTDADGDAHLRSSRAMTGYHIHATDGDIGHVCGMLIDDKTWAVRYLIVNTSNWWVGHKMLVAPPWIKAVSWENQSISVDLTRQAVMDAPVYNPAETLAHDSEARLYQHYGRDGYWAQSDKRKTGKSRI